MVAYIPQPSDLLLGAEASRRADAMSIERLGTSGLALMERAGEGAASFLFRRMATVGQPAALVLCGKGNNGGDGLVVARKLIEAGWEVAVALAYPESEFSPDAAANFRRLPESDRLTVLLPGDDLRPWLGAHRPPTGTTPPADRGTSSAAADFPESRSAPSDVAVSRPSADTADMSGDVFARGPVVVDALLGTGFRGAMRPELAAMLSAVADCGCPVLALDLPSGLDADTGMAAPEALVANGTVTFGTLKRGMFLEDGPDRCGEIRLVPLGFPDDILLAAAHEYPVDEAASSHGLKTTGRTSPSPSGIGSDVSPETGPSIEYVLRQDRLSVTPSKRRHKYDEPTVIVAGGSPGMVGAAVMAAKAAWSLGLGSVRVAFPAAHTQSVHVLLPQLANLPLGDASDGHFTPAMVEHLAETLESRPHVLLIGPGLGRHPESVEFVARLLASWHGPTVADADALFAMAGVTDSLAGRTAPLVLTPHPGELRRFAEPGEPRMGTITRLARRHNATVLSKGHPTILQTDKGIRFMTGYDTRVFNRVGYGDVLAGLIAGYLSLGGEPADSCAAALLESRRRFDVAASGKLPVEPWLLTGPTC